MSLCTIALKLHNPSKRKKEIIDTAMLNYSKAYQYLLDKAYERLDYFKTVCADNPGAYRAQSIVKLIDKNLMKELNQFDIQPFKDALKIDFGTTLSSFLALSKTQKNCAYPIAYLDNTQFEKKYNELCKKYINSKNKNCEYKREIDRLLNKEQNLKPLFFCRYDKIRDFCLLYDYNANKYYAKLYLMNCKDKNRKEIQNQNGKRELYYIHKHKELFTSKKKERFLLFPLSFGKWQEQYLKKAIESPEILKTARLTKKNGEYYLMININIATDERIDTQTYLGLGRGINSPIHYTVLNKNGTYITDASLICDMNTNQKNATKRLHNLHKLANNIVKIAYNQKSQVIVVSLKTIKDRLKWIDTNDNIHLPLISNYEYNQLIRILKYKLQWRGLPPPISISPVGIYYSCPDCRLHCYQNRFSKDIFICTNCGKTLQIDQLGSLNIAKRLNDNMKDLLKIL